MDRTTPRLDPRSLDDIVAQTEMLAAAYTADPLDPTSGWQPPASPGDGEPTLDLGAALIRVFGRMVQHLIEKLNQVPDKHRRAFVDLLGAARIPPRAARAPLTFHLAERSVGDVEVPAGTQALAEASAGPVTFETELPLRLTRARLCAVFVHDARGYYADDTAIAVGLTPGCFAAFAASPARPVEHELYVGVDSLATLPGAQQIDLTIQSLGAELPTPPSLTWEAPAGSGTNPLPAMTSSGSKWLLAGVPVRSLAPTTIGSKTARWLRAAIPSALPPLRLSATATINGSARLDGAFFNHQRLDPTRDMVPFGERPRFGDTFYVGSDAAFSMPDVLVRISFTVSKAFPVGGVHPSSDLTLLWETWDGVSTIALAEVRPTGTTGGSAGLTDNTLAFSQTGDVTFTLKRPIAPAVVGGIKSRWLRVRIIGGDYGKDTSYTPPTFAAVTINWSARVSQPPAPCLRHTEQTLEDVTADAAAGTLLARKELSDDDTALYLGFDTPFERGLVTLYAQIVPAPSSPAWLDAPPPVPLAVTWEYWNGRWNRLDLDDGTEGLLRSGLLRFASPSDSLSLVKFGRAAFWLRARPLADLVANAAAVAMPRLGRMLTNTVWATNARTARRETLGDSNGGANQHFKLSQAPVLAGAAIEVAEPAPPPASALVSVENDPFGAGVRSWVRWQEVPDFWTSGAQDRHYTLDTETGAVAFGDGHRGLIPPAGLRNVRAVSYCAGGGSNGNIAAGAITRLKTAVALVDGVTNLEDAWGGAELEPQPSRIERASRTIRHGGYAVTAQDFVDLALEASSAVARASVIPPSFSPVSQAEGAEPKDVQRNGQVVVVILPTTVRPGVPPPPGLLADVAEYLRARCAPGATITAVGPRWVGVDVTVHVAAASLLEADAVRARVAETVCRFLDPLGGGDGTGWDFGRRPRRSDLAACIAAVPGVDHLSYLDVRCDPPFDVDETAEDITTLSPDALTQLAGVVVYPRVIEVEPPGPVRR